MEKVNCRTAISMDLTSPKMLSLKLYETTLSITFLAGSSNMCFFC